MDISNSVWLFIHRFIYVCNSAMIYHGRILKTKNCVKIKYMLLKKKKKSAHLFFKEYSTFTHFISVFESMFINI